MILTGILTRLSKPKLFDRLQLLIIAVGIPSLGESLRSSRFARVQTFKIVNAKKRVKKDQHAKMAFLWGAIVLISVLLNSYLSFPPLFNMIQLDGGPNSVIEAVMGSDVALIASLINAMVAAVLCTRALFMVLSFITGRHAEHESEECKQRNGDGSPAKIGENQLSSSSSSSSLFQFAMLCVGLAGGYILSNTLVATHHVATNESMQSRYEAATAELSAIQQQVATATEGKEQCRIESADQLSELNGKVQAKEVMIASHKSAMSEADRVRDDLVRAKAELEAVAVRHQREVEELRSMMEDEVSKARSCTNSNVSALEQKLVSKDKLVAHLKDQMNQMGERFGIKIGELENSIFEAQESRRRAQVENGYTSKKLEKLKPEVNRLKRANEAIERKYKKETELHAGTMDEYTRTVMQLKEATDAVKKFLHDGDGEGLRKLVR